MADKWQDLGPVNQVLISFACIFSTALLITGFVVAKQQRDLRNVKCLAMNVYHEARGEPVSGQYAVANVTLNRVKADRYPDDVCRVVYQKAWVAAKQRYVAAFSWTTDGSPDIPKESDAWRQAMNVASDAYYDPAPGKVKGALFYHADYVKPRWAAHKLRIAKIGRHIFYK
jgi:spore germination cell wall hydrolase CwlJ-like protein